ncbi:MAG: biotin--[acetyl-CoA-carboxylase] ligase [Bacteroidales bacterium]|nr:biotin--[acetyl-CoA-carboxylase] ligase [Bacteroidales bacterium]
MNVSSLIHREQEIDSTNDRLNRLSRLSVLPELYTLWAEYQTKGKGQIGNTWESERNKNLTFSFLLHPVSVPASEQFVISEMISLAIRDTLLTYTDGISIKWPNDIYWHDQKICGILIENELCGSHISKCVVGVGLNVNQDVFRSDAPNPVSLKQIIGRDTDREMILSKILESFRKFYAAPQNVHVAYLSALYRSDGYYAYRDAQGVFEGRIVDVEPDGHLILQSRCGAPRRFAFKEVQFVLD